MNTKSTKESKIGVGLEIEEESVGQGLEGVDLSGGVGDGSQSEKKDEKKDEKKSEKKVYEFLRVLSEAKGSRVLIVIKGYPDPDSIASALAFEYIGERYGIESTILHFDEVSHQQNKALVKKLGIEMVQYDGSLNWKEYDYLVFNDTQTIDLPVKGEVEIPVLVWVDHHKNLGKKKSRYMDIREEVGSTSAIYTEYLKEGEIDLVGGNGDAVRLSTALMHGIRSDTDNFILASEIDFLGSAYLARIQDKDLLLSISHQSISAKTMDITQTSLQNKNIKGTYLLSGVGFVREEDRDGIGQAADYLLRREGIETVLVYGIVGGGYIDGSLRTKSDTLDPDKWMKDLFGASEEGRPYGGGRKDKGGVQVPLGVFGRCEDKDLLWKLVKKMVEDIFYAKIGISQDEKVE